MKTCLETHFWLTELWTKYEISIVFFDNLYSYLYPIRTWGWKTDHVLFRYLLSLAQGFKNWPGHVYLFLFDLRNRGWKTDLSYIKVPEAILAQGLNNWPALYVINKTEILVILLDLDNIHESTWKLLISTDFAVDLDQSLLKNSWNFLFVKSVLQSVSQEEGQRHRLTSLVWARAGSHGVDSSKFVQHPWFRSC